MRKILKSLLLLLPVLASASSLSGTPPYTAISNTTYATGTGGYSSGSTILVSDSVGNLFVSNQYGHNFGAATASGCPAGADFITTNRIGSTISGTTLWYKNTNNCMPIQVTTSYAPGTGVTLTAAPSTNAPSMVGGTLKQVVGVPEIDSSYPNSGGVVLSSDSNNAVSFLNYYELNGSNNYQFSFFQHLAKSHIDANTFVLASAGPRNLDVRDLATGNSNSYSLPKLCQKVRLGLYHGGVKFMYAGISDIYLICNKDGDSPKKAMLYRYNNTQGSFDAGQKFNPNDTLPAFDEDYKAASAKDGVMPENGIVFLEQSKTTGNILYINTCQDGSALGNCQPQTVSGITNVRRITGGVITDRVSTSSSRGFAALFVGNSNMIFKVDLDSSGNYKRYSTY